MPIRTTISVLNAFNTVFLSSTQSNLYYDEITPSHRYLMDMYEISIAATEIIAYLLHYYPTVITQSKIRGFTENRNESFMAVIDELKDRGFITKTENKGLACNCYTISEAAFSAFRKSMKYGMPVFKDCFSELRSCSLSALLSDKWQERWVISLNLPGNEQLKNAYEKLEIAKLDKRVQKLFWAMARYFTHYFADYFSMDSSELDLEFQDELGILAKEGLAIVITIDEDSKARSEYVLSPKAASILFYGHEELIKYDELAKYAEVIKCHDIEKKELFFSSDAQFEINNLRTMVSQKGFIRACGILARKKRAQSIQSLLWGPPGTGKTETVRQLALESGRDVIQFDVAKVTGYGWGATEKYYRALFRAYNFVAVISKNVPILLFNEADDILSKRLTTIERAIDKSENTIANILLQEIENMNGILLATTNLIDNLDKAFDRRFLFKTQLIKPDASARAKIWKSSIPELPDDDARKLAESFEMSGAQINNVVTKRDLAELYFEGDRGYDYIVRLCEKELATEKGFNGNRQRIGF